MPWPADQDHPLFPDQQVAERLAHHFQAGTRAMDQHNGGSGCIVLPQIDHIQPRASGFDQQIVLWISVLQDPRASLREQRQGQQRPHENN